MPAATLFGTLLREIRKQAGLGQAKLAACLHVARPTISRIETGRKKPPLDAACYERLRAVPGFTPAAVTVLQEAAQADKSTEDLGKLSNEVQLAHIATHHALVRRVLSERDQELSDELKAYSTLLTKLNSELLVQPLIELMTMHAGIGLQELAQPSTQATRDAPATEEEAAQEPCLLGGRMSCPGNQQSGR
jgi:transcriptional regulator with XRE-family HTH domain